MNTLKNWMERKGLVYTATNYGANYFNDHALDLHFDGITIGLAHTSYYTVAALETEIKKYCKRYGYEIIQHGGRPGYHYLSIMRRDDWEKLKKYETYSRKSQKQCENHIHFCYEYYGPNGHKELNEELSGIMEFYEDEYKASLAV